MAEAKPIVSEKDDPIETTVVDHPTKHQRKIHPTRFRDASGDRNVWSIVPEHGTAFEALLEPSYWAHVAKNLRPTDRVEANAEDGSYFAEFIVTTSSEQSAKVVLLRKVELEKEAPTSISSAFDVIWRGPHHKFAVIRKEDNTPLQNGFGTKEDGLQWLAINVKSLTR